LKPAAVPLLAHAKNVLYYLVLQSLEMKVPSFFSLGRGGGQTTLDIVAFNLHHTVQKLIEAMLTLHTQKKNAKFTKF
jgi:hypothetical protein